VVSAYICQRVRSGQTCPTPLDIYIELHRHNAISKPHDASSSPMMSKEGRTCLTRLLEYKTNNKNRIFHIYVQYERIPTSTKIKLSFPLPNPHEGDVNTNFLRLTTTLVAPEGHLVHLGDKSPRVTNTWRLLVKFSCLKIKQVTQDFT
jgi:hypothetical protein